MTTTQSTEPRTVRAKSWPKVLAWVGLVFGAIALLGSVVGGETENRLSGSLASIAILIPSAWWFFCEKRDHERRDTYETSVRRNEELTRYLGPQDQVILDGMGEVEPPKKINRRWPLVGMTSFILFLLGGILAPPAESGSESNAETSTSSTSHKTTSSMTTASSPTTNATEDTRKAEEAMRSEEAKRSEDARRSAEAKARQEEEARRAEEQRLSAQAEAERARSGAVQEGVPPAEPNTQPQGLVAPAPQQQTSYANCKDVWNSIGRPIYAGEPGYTSGRGKLDGNSDGVGCESDPR